MRRILLLMTVALMLAATMALSGVAQAKTAIGGPTAAQCKNLAIKTLGKGFDPSGHTFVVGTAGSDTFSNTNGPSEVFCGFGGDDGLFTLEAGDIFLGGGTFYGEAGNDTVTINYINGTFVQ